MMPVQDLLHRIRWDPQFGKGEFEIGYDDRVAGRVVRVPFWRVREVWRDGKLIWRRPPKEPV